MFVDLNNYKYQSRKSVLAQLMSKERIKTHFNPAAKTASFDLKNHIITIPIYNRQTSSWLVDAFIGHEVGHGLYTPNSDTYTKVIEQVSSDFGHSKETINQIFQVFEDVRINRLMVSKYPGLAVDFRYGYSDRFHNGDYGSTDEDFINQMSFPDRLNVYNKAGHCVSVRFTRDECDIVSKAFKTETFDDVEKAVRDFLDLFEKNPESGTSGSEAEDQTFRIEINIDGYGNDRIENIGNGNGRSGDTDKTDDDNKGQNTENEDGNNQDSGEDSDESSGKENEGTDELESGSGGNGASLTIDISTVEAENHSSESYTTPDNKTKITHQKINADDIDFNIHYKDILAKRSEVANTQGSWMKEAKKYVSFMANIFEQKKAAHEYKKMSHKKTGSLDMNSLSYYKTKEEIFIRRDIKPEYKNHGIVIMLDTSGSMSSYMNQTLRQVVLMVMFARRIRIPFMVVPFSEQGNYGFSYMQNERRKIKGVSAGDSFIGLLFDHKMTTTEYNRMITDWVCVNGLTQYERAFGGTPLCASTLRMYPIIRKFVQENNVENLTFISVTDGVSSDTIGDHYSQQYILEDPKSGKIWKTDTSCFYHPEVLNIVRDILHEENIRHTFVDFFIDVKIKGVKISKKKGYDESYRISPLVLEKRVSSDFEAHGRNRKEYLTFLQKITEKIAKFD